MTAQRHIQRTIKQTHRARFHDAPRQFLAERKQPLRTIHIDPAVRAATLKKLSELAKTARHPSQPTRDSAMSARDRAALEAQQRRATRDAEMKRTSDQLKNINANHNAYWNGRKTRDNPLAGLAMGLGAAGAAAGAAAVEFMGGLVNEGVRSVTSEGTADGIECFESDMRFSAIGPNVAIGPNDPSPGPGHMRPPSDNGPRPSIAQLNFLNSHVNRLNGNAREDFIEKWRTFLKTGAW